MQKVELLAPAGSILKLKTVLRYGADAVYLGGKAFNLRSRSHNFNRDELNEAVKLCHQVGKKIYVTLNILAHHREIEALPQFVRYLGEIGIDAVIVADLGVIDIVRENSQIPIHISTQASATNFRTVKMWHQLGAKRVVLARELSLSEIRKIRDHCPDVELEVFVHGAMCMTYSGRCSLSSYFADRDGNRGACANTCRWKFYVMEEKRPGEYFPVYEDDQGSHLYNSKDLCTIEFIDQIIATGVNGLKIEGRMKSLLYGATTTRAYRKAIDSYYSNGGFQFNPEWRQELETYSHRGYTNGFYFGSLDPGSQRLNGGYDQTYEMIGYVKEVRPHEGIVLELLNKLCQGTEIEIIKPNGQNIKGTVTQMICQKTMTNLDAGHGNAIVFIPGFSGAEHLDVVRQKIAMSSIDVDQHEEKEEISALDDKNLD